MTDNLNKEKNKTKDLVTAALCLAIALVLPVFTGQIPKIGNMLCPMHFPIIICGFLCGAKLGTVVGFIAPLLRSAIFGMPPIMPKGISMAFELATYGLVVALIYSRSNKSSFAVYKSLIIAMFAGRIVWGIARMFFTGIAGSSFTFSLFIGGAFLEAIPGIVLQIILIPILIIAINKQRL